MMHVLKAYLIDDGDITDFIEELAEAGYCIMPLEQRPPMFPRYVAPDFIVFTDGCIIAVAL